VKRTGFAPWECTDHRHGAERDDVLPRPGLWIRCPWAVVRDSSIPHKDLAANTDHSLRGHVETANQPCPGTEGDKFAALIDEHASLLSRIPFLRDRVVFLCTRERTVEAFPMSGLLSGRHDPQGGLRWASI
jgi:hypothetical protein